jgi:hypothetical protein
MQTREEFEEEYTAWIKSVSRDIAFALNQLRPQEIKDIIKRNEQYLKEPESVYGTNGLEAVRQLAPDNILLLSTDAVVFSQSIFVRMPGILDYAVAMNRRYYLGKWYSILTFNKIYLKEASETMLRYTLEHELLQKEIYEDNMRKNDSKKFSSEEKRQISDETLNKAIEKTGITCGELTREKQLMQKISWVSPLVPKPFAEAALYWYIEKYIEDFKNYGEASETEKEDVIGKKLNSDFKDWLAFSVNTYRTYLKEIKSELNFADYGYL